MESPELPECPVCLQNYDSESTIPRVLACGHSACEACLVRLPERYPETIRCPACTQLVKYPPQGPTALPKNIDLLSFSLSLNPNPNSGISQTPHKQSADGFGSFLPCIWSDEFYVTWKDWVLPSDAVSVETEVDDGTRDELCTVLKGRTGSGFGSGRVWFREDESVSLFRVGSLPGSDSSGFEFSYTARVLKCLSGMREEERNEMGLLLRVSVRHCRRVCKVYGFWGNLEDGFLYLGCERRNRSFLGKLGAGEDGFTKDGLPAFAMIAMEVCEVVSGLNSEGFVAGCFGFSCFSFDDFGHVEVDLNQVLVTGRKVWRSVVDSVSGGIGTESTDAEVLKVAFWNLFKDGDFVSPEVLIELLQKQGVAVECDSSRYPVGCGSDVWSLACVFLRLLLGKEFDEELVKNCGISFFDHVTYVSWIERVRALIEGRLGQEYASLRENLCQCLNYDPASRPLVMDLMKCIRELIIKPQCDIMASLEGVIKEDSGSFCLILGQLCGTRKEILETPKENGLQGSEISGGLSSVRHSEQLQSSEAQTLLRITRLINFPVLKSLNNNTDFCNLEVNTAFAVSCYEGSITQVHIIGEKPAPLLPQNFSIDSFVTTLAKLPRLKVLTLVSVGLWGTLPGKIARLSSLEILNVTSNFLYGTIPPELSSLKSLQTLVLDDNKFSGPLPEGLSSLPVLSVLSLKKNSFNSSLPSSLSDLENLRVLGLSQNHFHGELPDFSRLTNLQVLEVGDNAFGPQFPKLGKKLVTLVLRKNKFRSSIPAELSSYYQLQCLDVSSNVFMGPFPPSLLSLPSITYLNFSGNKFTGMLFENLPCNAELKDVDLSSNLLTGSLPKCLESDSKDRDVLYASNCLATSNQNQHPVPFCRNEALAVGIVPDQSNRKKASKAALAVGIIGGIFGGVLLVGLIFLVYRRINTNKTLKKSPPRSITENGSSGYTSKLLSDARYISQTMKMGALGLPSYRTFSLEELVDATHNFDTSTFMGEGSHGQMYRGLLKDGSFVAIRCLKMKGRHSTQNFMHHIELIMKLRHRHLVSALGHCFECYLDDSSVSRIFLVFEYVPYGTLRSWISEGHPRRSLAWTQRIAAAIGIAKGIQFLHTGIMPGVYSSNLKITDILLDQNFGAKISSYNLPLLEENMEQGGHGASSSGSITSSTGARKKHDGRTDVRDFGVILLELIKGRPVKSEAQIEDLEDQLQVALTADEAARRSVVDSRIKQTCLDLSVKTMMEVCVRCLREDPADRPSIEDVLWNLQYAEQVQDAWQGGESQSSEGSPVSSPKPPRLAFKL